MQITPVHAGFLFLAIVAGTTGCGEVSDPGSESSGGTRAGSAGAAGRAGAAGAGLGGSGGSGGSGGQVTADAGDDGGAAGAGGGSGGTGGVSVPAGCPVPAPQPVTGQLIAIQSLKFAD